MRYIFEDKEENYELEDKLQEILDEKNIDFTFDEHLRLCVPNKKQKEVENILKNIGLEYTIYTGGDNSYEKYYLRIHDNETLNILEEKLYGRGIEYDYDSGGRILIPTINAAKSELIFEELGIKYDLI